MRKLLLLFGVLAASCIDRDYDLTQIDTNNVVVGDCLRFPLATIRVTMAELRQNGTDIEEVFAEADDWLPSSLPGGTEWVDIPALNAGGSYLDALIDALITEMKQPDGRKLRTVAGRICTKHKYAFLGLLGLPANVSDEQFISTFQTEFLRQTAVQTASAQLARDYLGDIRVDALSYRIDRVDITEEVVNMLVDNLDAESVPADRRTSTLHLFGEVRSRLPLTMTLSPQFSATRLDFTVAVDAKRAQNPIAESDGTQLFEEDLRQIVAGIDIRIPVALERYYPALGFRSEEPEQVAIDLRLIKRGGLKIEIER